MLLTHGSDSSASHLHGQILQKNQTQSWKKWSKETALTEITVLFITVCLEIIQCPQVFQTI